MHRQGRPTAANGEIEYRYYYNTKYYDNDWLRYT
jgi:hypothetical protein